MKIAIQPLPPDPKRPYSHLQPLVDALVNGGNAVVEQGFHLDKDGWRCQLRRPIDFGLLRRQFTIPASILLSDQHDTILCQNTWAEIHGGASSR